MHIFSKTGITVLSVTALLIFAGCPRNAVELPAGKVGVVFSGALAPDPGTKSDDVDNDSLLAVHVTIESITLEQEDGTLVPVLPAPVTVDILSAGEIGGLVSAASLPAGTYVRGTLVVSSAEVEFVDNPGVLVPVALPDGGEFEVEIEFEINPSDQGALILKLEEIEIEELDDSSLTLEAELELESEIHNDDDEESELPLGAIDSDGVIDDVELEDNTFEMEIGDGEVEVDYATAQILLPPATEGGEPIAGSAADLADDACVHVTGELVLTDDDIILVADTIQILAYDCDDDDDSFDDDDDDDDDDDEGDDEGEDD